MEEVDAMRTKKLLWIIFIVVILLGFYMVLTSTQTKNKMTIEELNEKYHMSFDHMKEDQIKKEKDSLFAFTYHYKITDMIYGYYCQFYIDKDVFKISKDAQILDQKDLKIEDVDIKLVKYMFSPDSPEEATEEKTPTDIVYHFTKEGTVFSGFIQNNNPKSTLITEQEMNDVKEILSRFIK